MDYKYQNPPLLTSRESIPVRAQFLCKRAVYCTLTITSVLIKEVLGQFKN